MFKQKIIFNKRPIYFTILLVVLAINLIAFFILDNLVVFGILIGALSTFLIMAIIFFIVKKKYGLLILSTISTFLVALILIKGFLTIYNYNTNVYNQNYYFVGRVGEIKSCDINGDNYSYELVVSGDILGRENKALVKVNSNKEIFEGSIISFSGYFYKNPKSFGNKISSIVFNDKVYYGATNISKLRVENSFNSPIYKIKHNLVVNFKKFMPNVYPFTYAILTGNTCYFDSQTLLDFRQSGVSHILAVSGLHVGFLYCIIHFILKLFKVKKKLSFIISLITLFLYVWFCGFTPSCLRAFFIIMLFKLSNLLGLKGDRITIALCSMCAILLINPFDLFSIGFILSFVAYFSIILLSKPFERILSKIFTIKLSKFLSPYLAVYLGTMPIVVLYFGYVSLFSILFNIIVLPLVSIAFVFNFIFALGSLLFSNPYVFSIMPNLIFNGINVFITSAETSLFLVSNITFKYSIIFYYITLFCLTNLLNFSKKTKVILATISILLFILLFIGINLTYNLDFLFLKC